MKVRLTVEVVESDGHVTVRDATDIEVLRQNALLYETMFGAEKARTMLVKDITTRVAAMLCGPREQNDDGETVADRALAESGGQPRAGGGGGMKEKLGLGIMRAMMSKDAAKASATPQPVRRAMPPSTPRSMMPRVTQVHPVRQAATGGKNDD